MYPAKRKQYEIYDGGNNKRIKRKIIILPSRNTSFHKLACLCSLSSTHVCVFIGRMKSLPTRAASWAAGNACTRKKRLNEHIVYHGGIPAFGCVYRDYASQFRSKSILQNVLKTRSGQEPHIVTYNAKPSEISKRNRKSNDHYV
jgi:hypothetical protein